jgi:phosphoribosylformylglycinamidine synthase
VLLGPRDLAGAGHPLAASRWAVEVRDHRTGRLPPFDPESHRRVAGLVAELVAEHLAGGPGLLTGVHDVSGGGLAVALAEMARSSGVGATVALDGPAELFCEAPSRVVVATARPEAVVDRAVAAGVPAVALGSVGGARLVVDGLVDLAVTDLAVAARASIAGALGDTA